jgi:hypothetical protein
MTETPVELKKILQAKAPDLSLQADDLLVVPSSRKDLGGAHARGRDARLRPSSVLPRFRERIGRFTPRNAA